MGNTSKGENGRAIMDADAFYSLTHFKGHEMTGFGGAIKNIGMGCGSRAGKKEQHNDGTPTISQENVVDVRDVKECANNGLVFNKETKKMSIQILRRMWSLYRCM